MSHSRQFSHSQLCDMKKINLVLKVQQRVESKRERENDFFFYKYFMHKAKKLRARGRKCLGWLTKHIKHT